MFSETSTKGQTQSLFALHFILRIVLQRSMFEHFGAVAAWGSCHAINNIYLNVFNILINMNCIRNTLFVMQFNT